MRAAGLVHLLPGGAVDHGDVSSFRWRPDPRRPSAKNAAAVARVATSVAAGTARILARDQLPLVVGGDCSITAGVVSGFALAGAPPALLYVDGGPDLFTPATRSVGNLDAMGLACMLGVPGCVPELAGIGPSTPLLSADEVVSYGHALPPGDVELEMLDKLAITHLHADEIHADPAAAASRAREAIESAGPRFVVHCDVDVLSFVDTPLADVPDSGGEPIGLTLDELATSLSVFTASPRFAGLVLTEINPDHAPDPSAVTRFVTRFAAALR